MGKINKMKYLKRKDFEEFKRLSKRKKLTRKEWNKLEDLELLIQSVIDKETEKISETIPIKKRLDKVRKIFMTRMQKEEKNLRKILKKSDKIIIRPNPKDIGKKRYICGKCKQKYWTKKEPIKCIRCGGKKIFRYFRI